MGSNEACSQISLLGCGVEAGSTPNRVKKKVSEVILTTLEINAIQIFYLVAAENESFRVIKRERRSRYVTFPWQHRILKKMQSKIHRSLQCNLIPGTSYRSDEQIHFANNQFTNEILTWFDYNSSFRNL